MTAVGPPLTHAKQGQAEPGTDSGREALVPDPQTEWAQLLLDSLVAAGVRAAVISPGSRSTPLVWAASNTAGLTCHCIIDERSAGFYALGQARISGLPSLLICTSGSALSNYFPAVIEARESGIPLIVLSADRPFELQHCGAHQTIDQTRLFGAYAPYHELGTPVADRDALLALRRTAWQSVQRSLDVPRGAVHLNFRAKKPLEPSDEPARFELPGLYPREPLARSRRSGVSDADLEKLLGLLDRSTSPLLILGASTPQEAPSPELVRRFADLTGSVVCAESVSQLRLALVDAGAGLACDSYDWLLAHPALSRQLAPDFVLQLGGTPVSAVLERLLSSRSAPPAFAICAESGWPDSLHQSAEILRARAPDLLEAACAALQRRPRAHRPRLELWRQAQLTARSVIDRHTASRFGEAAAVVEVCAALPRGSVLAIGNSLPPRLLDRYVASVDRSIRVCCQRGASGIEGALAGALGAASQTEEAVTLLVGDISFLHDIGSLWAAVPERAHAAPRAQPIVIVVLNNAGGRIFEQLPIAAKAGVALELWTTPHQMRLRGAAELYGIGYGEVSLREQLVTALAGAYRTSGVTLLEVRVEPSNVAESQRIVSAELEPLLLALRPG
jgi:2-succinyl-5-enolpyruvyl-6-hydroxy-3-cyclohexene-1-carboxylate synthase